MEGSHDAVVGGYHSTSMAVDTTSPGETTMDLKHFRDINGSNNTNGHELASSNDLLIQDPFSNGIEPAQLEASLSGGNPEANDSGKNQVQDEFLEVAMVPFAEHETTPSMSLLEFDAPSEPPTNWIPTGETVDTEDLLGFVVSKDEADGEKDMDVAPLGSVPPNADSVTTGDFLWQIESVVDSPSQQMQLLAPANINLLVSEEDAQATTIPSLEKDDVPADSFGILAIPLETPTIIPFTPEPDSQTSLEATIDTETPEEECLELESVPAIDDCSSKDSATVEVTSSNINHHDKERSGAGFPASLPISATSSLQSGLEDTIAVTSAVVDEFPDELESVPTTDDGNLTQTETIHRTSSNLNQEEDVQSRSADFSSEMVETFDSETTSQQPITQDPDDVVIVLDSATIAAVSTEAIHARSDSERHNEEEDVQKEVPMIEFDSETPSQDQPMNQIAEIVIIQSDSATIVDIPPSSSDAANAISTSPRRNEEDDAEKDVVIVELQSSLQEQMSQRAEAEERARRAEERLKKAEQELQRMADVEKKMEDMCVAMMTIESAKSHLEMELPKLREARDEHERKQIVLSNRLNAAKKKEAVKANLAEQLEEKVKRLQGELADTKHQLEETQASKKKLGEDAQDAQQQLMERLKQAEVSLADERRLNEERKKKMKIFIETKQEELREAKAQSDDLNVELEQSNRLLREHDGRWKQLHAQWVQSQTRNRELQRDLNRIKKDSDDLHKIGDKMEMKLSRSAQETEEHKNKRLTAKHELMTILRTLEAEREVSSKLRDSIKFTFTPKALSQQQLLRESLQDFEAELLKLSRRLGRPLPPSNDSAHLFSLDSVNETSTNSGFDVLDGDGDDNVEDEGYSGISSPRRNRSELDSTHLLSNLEDETQRVSKCIMALTSSIDRMHTLLDESGDRTCLTVLSNLLATGGAQVNSIQEETTSITSGAALMVASRTRYGHIPTSPN